MFLLLYWPTYSDAGSDNLWSLFHSSEAPFFNLSYWKNTDYDKLVDDAGGAGPTTRATPGSEAQKLMVRFRARSPAFLRRTRVSLPEAGQDGGRPQHQLPVCPVSPRNEQPAVRRGPGAAKPRTAGAREPVNLPGGLASPPDLFG